MSDNSNQPILHVVVVGFHHKKGCQVEYAYPPLVEGQPVDSHEVPLVWKHLPSLALPDGAHNYNKDIIFFHLPSQEEKCTVIYGVSCYRQIDAKEVVNKTSEVTRNSVQKCVCVLSRLPLYGVISAKLEMITHAWFSDKDFSQLSLLEEMFRQLCVSCTDSMLEGSQVFHGLSPRDLVLQHKHDIVTLFKLVLLERKVLIFGSPVHPVCGYLLSLLSLFPDMVEYGLKEATFTNTSQQLSQTMRNVRAHSASEEEYLEIHYTTDNSSKQPPDSDVMKNNNNTDLPSHSGDSQSMKNASDVSKSSHDNTLKLQTGDGVSLENTVSNGGTTPGGGVREKSENEKLEKQIAEDRRETVVVDSHICQARSQNCVKLGMVNDLNINSVTHVEAVQQKSTHSQSDEVILEQCVRTSPKIDPLQFVEDITHVESVQKGVSKSVTETFSQTSAVSKNSDQLQGVLETSVFTPLDDSRSSAAATPQQDDDLSEGTASEFGTVSNVEDLLETEEESLDWKEENLLLEIDAELGSPVDPLPEKRVERMDSTTSWASQASSVASDLGGASVKVMGDIKSKLSSMWESAGNQTDECEHTDMAAVHHLSQPTDCQDCSPQRSGDGSPSKDNDLDVCKSPVAITSLKSDECGFPLPVFTKGVLCHPYLSLQYFDILQDVNVRGFLIGASNMLFKQKKHLLDVVIEVDSMKIAIHDDTLKRQLALSTADLRFAEYLTKSVSDDKGNVFLDETEWEGGDEWLRGQFKLYLASMLVTMQKGDEKLQEDFNPHFVAAYKTTNNYRVWISQENRGLKEAPPGHPFHGQMSMQDVKMKFSHLMQGTDKGKKIMAAAGQTGKVAVQTGKAIGGAITNAKSTVTGWFSSIRQWSSSDLPSED